MLIDSNRGLIITDDTLNITYIKERSKGLAITDEADLESALSPHFTAILEVHDHCKKVRQKKKSDKKEKKKKKEIEQPADLDKSMDSTVSAGANSDVSEII